MREQKIYTVLSALGSAGARESLLIRLRNHFGFLTLAIPFINPVRSKLLSEEILDVHGVKTQLTTAAATSSSPSSSLQGFDSSNSKSNNDDNVYSGSTTTTTLQQENQDVKKQLEDLQKRIQLMELMLKAYYINDEIFSNLHSAVSNNEEKDTNMSRTSVIHKKSSCNKNNDNDDDDGHLQHWRTSRDYAPSHLTRQFSGAQTARDDRIPDLDEAILPPVGGRSMQIGLSGIQQLQSRRNYREELAHLVDRNV
ncbi:hypothetical protein BDB00DRAFT_183675 [Zychaea mexicana]|uniref:uncharacterized protein n=1 Tax=Zychaea mexicana TaxID=64656 RepID=UPI0022FE6EDC|nr:uncharacterized protein BDB00DRAFT_183675 [Zychaea mexicana]KAI9479523.1 hypothetical protein BDB00DRAFT_183675 [Zychaea mexicana]